MIGTSIQDAVEVLKGGGLVAIPTETVYGLAACIANDEAVLSIFKAKNRPGFDPLIVHVSSLNDLKPLVKTIPEQALKLAEAFWPGPLTLLFEKSDKVSDIVSSGLPTVAIRMPQHNITLEMLRALGEPVAAPSANPFGYVSPTTAEHVERQLGDKVGYILDGGQASIGLESTIVSVLDNEVRVLRLGGLSIERLTEVLGFEPKLTISKHSNPEAPGQLDKHYATKTPLYLSNDLEADLRERISEGEKWGIIALKKGKQFPENCEVFYLSENGDLDEAARNLFSVMRKLDEFQLSGILAERLPDVGLGKAMNDRLNRAAYRN